MARTIEYRENIRPIMAAIKSTEMPVKTDAPAPPGTLPFITISREPGAGGWTLATQMVDALNMTSDHPWTCWDRELIEKVAQDEHVSAELVNSLEEQSHSWLGDFLAGLPSSEAGAADEGRLYGRIAASIRALAQAGNVVIVGMGAVFITRHMPGGIHLRLVAPLPHRIDFMARYYRLSPAEAEARIKQLERSRQSFLKRYWPTQMLNQPETFTLTINTALIEQEKIARMVRVLVAPGA